VTRKRALITGVTGQDGSYLCEHLLDLGYEVHGTIRTTTSDIASTRIAHLVVGDEHKVTLHVTDLGDSHSLMRLIESLHPDEVYNLAAQSHVRHSFDQPVHTGDVTGLGAVRILEAIRHSKTGIRFYQASSSEMFGSAPPPQSEDTPFHPRSPYAVAKVYAYWATVNYRESYGIHASNGILFNHESVPGEMPVVVRRHGFVDILPIAEVVPHGPRRRGATSHTSAGGGWEVWDGERWVACTARSATWREEDIRSINARGGVIEASDDHLVFTDDGDKAASAVRAGDRVVLADLPPQLPLTTMTEDEAWLLGILVSRGLRIEGGRCRIACHDEAVLAEAARCWERVAGGTSRKGERSLPGVGAGRTPALELLGNPWYLRMVRHELFTSDGQKRVPKRILNAAPTLQLSFLTACSLGDGFRAGADSHPLVSFRTSSAVLAAGLAWLSRALLGSRIGVSLHRGSGGSAGRSYLLDPGPDTPAGPQGAHLHTPAGEVRRVESRPFAGWLFDLATESGRFVAGPGLVVIHNSPRRGKEFVTRKITSSIPRLLTGEQSRLRLGNLEAKRDWGHARDYVKAMQLMLQADEPSDLVIGTGEAHSVRDFLDVAFDVVGLDWQEYVDIDPAFYRPAEVDYLQADAAKAERLLGWKPATSFPQLVEEMVRADMSEHGLEVP
jgi:GDPmannose 4,6-dehydratase